MISSKIKKINKNQILIILAFILSILPIIVFKLRIANDVNFHVSRIEGIVSGIKNGNFPVFIYPEHNNFYGYASPIFYSDIFLYIPALLNLLGINIYTSYKIFIILINAFILFSMYFATYKITNSKKSAAITSSIYLFSSYRIIDMFQRAAIGELFGFVFFPFLILGLYEIIYGNYKNGIYYLIGIVGLVLSHNINLLFAILVSLIFIIVNCKKIIKDKNRLKSLLKYGILSIITTSFFTLPMLELMLSDKFVYSTYYSKSVSEHASSIITLFLDYTKNIDKIPGIGLSFVMMFIWFLYKKSKTKSIEHKKFNILLIISGLFFLFMSSSLFPWDIFNKYFGIIQFPWRLYILATVLFAFSISLLINEEDNLIYIIAFIFIFYGLVLNVKCLASFRLYDAKYDPFIAGGEYLPIDVDRNKLNKNDKTISNNDIEINEIKNGSNMQIEIINNDYDNTFIEVPLIYYKGYKCISEKNENLKVEKGTNGRIKIYLDKNDSKIKLYYGYTKVRIISLFTTLIGIILLVLDRKNTTHLK